MQRLLVSVLFLLSAVGTSHAQTIKITTANGSCTYPTGTVTQDASVPGQLLATVPSGQAPAGTGCGSTSGTYGPVTYVASPLTRTTAVPLSNNGGPANFTFQPVNADHCTGTITPSTGTAFTSTFCSSLASCQTLQNVTATFPANPDTSNLANYTVNVSCTGPGSTTAVASPASAAVSVNPTGVVSSTCPTLAGTTAPSGFLTVASWTQRVASMSATYFSAGSKNVDPTSFISIFNLPGQTVYPWPATYNAPVVFNLPISNYVSAAFTTPAKYFSATNAPNPLYGEYSVGSSSFSATVSMTISTSCGDFGQISPTTVVPGCVLNKGGDTSFFTWANSSTCILHDSQQYFLNVINADISSFPARSTAKSSVCPGSACSVPLQNGPGDWHNYTPNP